MSAAKGKTTNHLTTQKTEGTIFFFFFFHCHVTPHSPTGMAGVPIRTPTRGANYVQTQKK